jgi:xylulokinase
MMDAFVLAIDIGTGGTKVALVAASGEVAASAARDVPVALLPDGGAEQDAEAWWRAVVAGTREALGRGVVPPGQIVAVAVTGMWSVTVPVDAHANPIGPAIAWMDRRGGKYCSALSRGLINYQGYDLFKLARWLHLCGGVPTHSGADSLAHILFLKHERPQTYHAAYKFLEPMDFITFRLTGRCAAPYGTAFPLWVTDNRDPRNVKYHDGLLRLAGLDRAKLPELVAPDTVLGPVRTPIARELGLPDTIPVLVSSGDNHSAILGAGAVRDFEGHVYIGTTSWISCHVPFKKTNIRRFITTMPAAVPGRNMVLAQQSTAAQSLQWLRDHIFFAGDGLTSGDASEFFTRLDPLVETAPPGSDGLIFLPWLTGTLTPAESKNVRAGFVNISLHTTRAHMLRAVMEGVAFNLRWLLPHVEKFTGRPMDTLSFIGGGAQSSVWCQILADILDRPIRQVVAPRQANVRGAALLALTALGRIALEDVAARVGYSAVYAPDQRHRAQYDGMSREFSAFFTRNRAMFRRLNAGRPRA